MIYSITGTVTHKGGDFVVVRAGGVGYMIYVAAPLAARLIKNKRADLVCFHVAEKQELYGFADEKERDLFVRLVSVSGVGPKKAMKLFDAFSAKEIAAVVVASDVDMLAGRGGIGKKTASKIILELKDKIQAPKGVSIFRNDEAADIKAALSHLGYTRNDIAYAMDALSPKDGDARAQVKKALKILAARNNS
jgi:holliday junction DNA helicase RuvA